MDISGILNSLGSVLPFGDKAKPEAVEPVANSQPQPPTSSISPKAQEALADILSRYDVTAISPRSFSQLVQELHQAGVLQDADQEQLALLRLELDQQGVG